MAKPIWETAEGTLGKIEEGIYYRLNVVANSDGIENITYAVISGYLSPGLVLDSDGSIYGEPRLRYNIEGIPYEVDRDVTSTFCIRATSEAGEISDRTFSLTVTGQDTPIISNPAGSLGEVLTGQYIEIQIEIDSIEENEVLSYDIVKGFLPEGLSLNNTTGLISGYPLPYISDYNAGEIGWDAPSMGWGHDAWGLSQATSAHKNYEFTIEVFDGKEKRDKVFSILVLSKSLLRADSTFYTVDSDKNVTGDMDTVHDPIMITKNTDLGLYEHNNYFSYRLQAIDIDNDQISFGIDSGSLPNGLVLDSVTGWIYGYIPSQTLSQTEFVANIYSYKTSSPSYRSDTIELKVTTVSNLYNAIIWKTPSDLGTIESGEICNLAIETVNKANLSVSYLIPYISDDYEGTMPVSQLPQGLVFQSNGLIIGRPSFEVTSFDIGRTTFDVNVREAGVRTGITTWDREFKFTVVAKSLNNEVQAEREFTLKVSPKNYEPYESLYLRSNLTSNNIWQEIVYNTDIFPISDIYRNTDKNFGIQKDARMLLISGISSKSTTRLMEALGKNHYRKVLKFGQPKLAKSYKQDLTVEYEVIYYDIVDDQNNTNNDTISRQIDLTGQISHEVISSESKIPSDAIVYPNSLEGMRSQLIENIGFAAGKEILPNWMKNRQPDGSIIGWKPVVVLSYLKPGTGDRALFNLKRKNILDQKTISFDVDKYIWDKNLSVTYDSDNEEYYQSLQTTFDSLTTISNPPVATVDFALDVPFSSLHGKTSAQINAAGGLDQIITAYQDKLVIFAKQEDYTGLNDEFEAVDGWLKTITFYDDPDGYDATDKEFDEAEVIPGYQENFADSSITNQRAGVWKFVKDTASQLWYLEFQNSLPVTNGDYIVVSNGFKYGGKVVQYSTTIDIGNTVPEYNIIESIQDLETPTTFDGNATKFINQVIVFQDPDTGDSFLPFPKTNIWQ